MELLGLLYLAVVTATKNLGFFFRMVKSGAGKD